MFISGLEDNHCTRMGATSLAQLKALIRHCFFLSQPKHWSTFSKTEIGIMEITQQAVRNRILGDGSECESRRKLCTKLHQRDAS
ncbi:hypothetical protein M758_7G034100 [Ceratodon purpureus]|uniref:Uncharacterized protein n=1 Tax=Ceratodon purpureus TaxID=3225 RepID=A0A8T0H438_CERPU|nr:hypothetical protein KC19_7G035300 [Ceratodon purpureus]KAG0610040.1 hypothetical protein M758_7G034100 [Ceratodon purpureus]